MNKVFLFERKESITLTANSLKRRITRYAIAASFCIFTLSILTAPAQAGNITYDVSLLVGSAGSVTGFIETNGDLGVLSYSDVLDWNLLVTDGITTNDLEGPLSGDNSIYGGITSDTGITATIDVLTYDFTDVLAVDYFFVSNGLLSFCLTGATNSCNESPSLNIYPYPPDVSGTQDQFTAESGSSFVIATAAGTPEPGTLRRRQ